MTAEDQATVQRSKLHSVLDTLGVAESHHKYRDMMNGELHMQEVRWSPLTIALSRAIGDLATFLRETSDVEAGEEA